MIRQATLAVGVAIFVAIIGQADTPAARLAAFDRGWWVMAAVTVLSLIPVVIFFSRPKPAAAVAVVHVK